MLLNALAPLLLWSSLQAAPATVVAPSSPAESPALEQVKKKQKRAFEDEELDDGEEGPRGVKRRVNPDGAAVAFLKTCGVMCLTGCGIWLLSGLVAIIPGVGWLAALGLQLSNPIITSLVGWFVLQKWSQRRAPVGAMVLGVGLPFWGVLLVNFVGSVILGVLVPILAVLASLGVTLFLLSNTSTDPDSVLLGILGSYAVVLIPTLLVGLLAGVGTLVLLGALGGGTVLGAGLGVLLGRGQVENEKAINLDLFSVDDPEEVDTRKEKRRARDGDGGEERRRKDPTEDGDVQKAQPEGGEEVVPKQEEPPPAAPEAPPASPVAPAPGPVVPPAEAAPVSPY
jgi:hypothetical protein